MRSGGSSGSGMGVDLVREGTRYPGTTVKIAAFGKDLYRVSYKVLLLIRGFSNTEGVLLVGVEDGGVL